MTPWTHQQHAHHWPRMVRLARRYVGDGDAEDIAQDALIRSLTGTFRGDAELSTWLHRIVVNTALTAIGKRRYADHEIPEQPDHDTPEEQLLRSERHIALHRAIAALSEPHREALGLYLRLDSYPEIARTTGLPEGTVKSRINRAREALRNESLL